MLRKSVSNTFNVLMMINLNRFVTLSVQIKLIQLWPSRMGTITTMEQPQTLDEVLLEIKVLKDKLDKAEYEYNDMEEYLWGKEEHIKYLEEEIIKLKDGLSRAVDDLLEAEYQNNEMVEYNAKLVKINQDDSHRNREQYNHIMELLEENQKLRAIIIATCSKSCGVGSSLTPQELSSLP